jgi:protein-disulfide isomerase
VKAEDVGMLYKVTTNYRDSDIDVFISKNGQWLFVNEQPMDVNVAVTTTTTQATTTTLPGPVEVSADDDPRKGPADAPVEIIEFSDFQCPFCKRGADTMDAVVDQYGDQVTIVFKDFPLSFHNNAQIAGEAGECADDQNKFWEMHDWMFNNQGALDKASLKSAAADLGLDSTEFDDCLDTGKYTDEVKADMAQGQSVGVSGTPAFFVNGILVSGAQPLNVFQAIIDAELAAA